MDRDYVLRTPLNQIDINDSQKLRPLNTLYLGVKVMHHVQKTKIPAATLTDFHVHSQNFLRVACREIKKRFDFDDTLLTQIVCLSPAAATDAKIRAKHPSLLPLMQQVPRLIDMTDADRLQAIDDQWRRLPLVALSKNTKAMHVDEFWHHISTLEDFVEDTLNELVHTSECVKNAGGCPAFKPTSTMLRSMTPSNLYRKRTPSTSGNTQASDDSDPEAEVVFIAVCGVSQAKDFYIPIGCYWLPPNRVIAYYQKVDLILTLLSALAIQDAPRRRLSLKMNGFRPL
ncbi:unnamed protein product [Leuciscus chuanchicus]